MDTGEQSDHRPMPGPGDTDSATDDESRQEQGGDEAEEPGSDDAAEPGSDIPEPKEGGDGKIALDRSDESQDFVDQSKIDFDPDEGLYSGTAVDGTSEIPGPHAGDGDEQSVIDQAKEMAGDDPPESEGQIGTMMRSRSKKEDSADGESGAESGAKSGAKDDRTPDSSDEQAYE
jgi:hypothetical protein